VLVPVGDSTPEDIVRWARKGVGLSEAEIRCDPSHGWVVSMAGIRKLAARVPDAALKMEFLGWLEDEFPTT
jgi:hypothetical protein